ncbi:MAG: GTPase Era [Acidobacteria bacterium]|nr:GTPase Era [Acidobacteriota bacterium]
MSALSGFFAVVGRPNVGKSTLVNALVGTKVAITSSRPQTTRNTIRGVLTLSEPQRQFIFVDTPGLHKPKNSLGERLNRLVYGSLAEVDGALFLVDATKKIGPGDRLIAKRLAQSDLPVVLVVNKTDIAKPDQVISQLQVAGEWDFHAYVPVSALKESGMTPIIEELTPLLTDGPLFFPVDMVTDQPDFLWAGELVREKFLRRLHEELPHSLAVLVEEIETRPNGLVAVSATVFVERKSQKGIVIGKGGALLRDVGREARADLERMFGAKVFLDLRVKVEPDWQRKDASLDRLGF